LAKYKEIEKDKDKEREDERERGGWEGKEEGEK